MHYGKVVHFSQERGFGFLYCDELQRRVFFHVSEVSGTDSPIVSQSAFFELVPDSKGRQPRAINVKIMIDNKIGTSALQNGIQRTPESGTEVLIKAVR